MFELTIETATALMVVRLRVSRGIAGGVGKGVVVCSVHFINLGLLLLSAVFYNL